MQFRLAGAAIASNVWKDNLRLLFAGCRMDIFRQNADRAACDDGLFSREPSPSAADKTSH
jgi:hypothetical protein